MNTLEKEIERYLVNRVKQFGGKALKMVPEFESGVPDRLVVLNGQTIFVELKAPGKQPRKLQALFMQELEKAGAKTTVIDSREGVEQLVASMMRPAVQEVLVEVERPRGPVKYNFEVVLDKVPDKNAPTGMRVTSARILYKTDVSTVWGEIHVPVAYTRELLSWARMFYKTVYGKNINDFLTSVGL